MTWTNRFKFGFGLIVVFAIVAASDARVQPAPTARRQRDRDHRRVDRSGGHRLQRLRHRSAGRRRATRLRSDDPLFTLQSLQLQADLAARASISDTRVGARPDGTLTVIASPTASSLTCSERSALSRSQVRRSPSFDENGSALCRGSVPAQPTRLWPHRGQRHRGIRVAESASTHGHRLVARGGDGGRRSRRDRPRRLRGARVG